MLAIKCDRCGSFDEPYINSTDVKAIQIRVKHIDRGTFDSVMRNTYCLCSNCVKKFEEFINDRTE